MYQLSTFLYIQVDLNREYTFRNSKRTYNGIPVVASNMDTVGTFEMAKELAKVTISAGKISCFLHNVHNHTIKKHKLFH